MEDKQMLMIPGPTAVPEAALLASAKHPIGHRTREFSEIMEEVIQNLKWLHQTENDVLTITGSGTAAMEAGIINTLSRGDKVICGENGKFGERWVKVAKEFGLEVIKINLKIMYQQTTRFTILTVTLNVLTMKILMSKKTKMKKYTPDKFIHAP